MSSPAQPAWLISVSEKMEHDHLAAYTKLDFQLVLQIVDEMQKTYYFISGLQVDVFALVRLAIERFRDFNSHEARTVKHEQCINYSLADLIIVSVRFRLTVDL